MSDTVSLPVVSGLPRTAAHRLVESNLGLIWNIIYRRFSSITQNPEHIADAYNDGCMALIRAAECFDPSRGFQFSTYASNCIAGRILRTIIARRTIYDLKNTVSLDMPLGEQSDPLMDIISDPTAILPEKEVVQAIAFSDLITPLNKRQQFILRALYIEGRKYAEIAETLGITVARARQIHYDTLRQLSNCTHWER